MPENSKTEIAKTYTPKAIEKKWYQTWLDKKYFQAKSQSDQPSFSIVIPPPNITFTFCPSISLTTVVPLPP